MQNRPCLMFYFATLDLSSWKPGNSVYIVNSATTLLTVMSASGFLDMACKCQNS